VIWFCTRAERSCFCLCKGGFSLNFTFCYLLFQKALADSIIEMAVHSNYYSRSRHSSNFKININWQKSNSLDDSTFPFAFLFNNPSMLCCGAWRNNNLNKEQMQSFWKANFLNKTHFYHFDSFTLDAWTPR
jgi:hypothetical protein